MRQEEDVRGAVLYKIKKGGTYSACRKPPDNRSEDEIHAADLSRRKKPAERSRAPGMLRGIDRARARAPRQRGIRERQPAASDRDGDERARARRQAYGDRRPVRGDARAARRIFFDRREKSRRGDRRRRARPDGEKGNGRGAAGDRPAGAAGMTQRRASSSADIF